LGHDSYLLREKGDGYDDRKRRFTRALIEVYLMEKGNNFLFRSCKAANPSQKCKELDWEEHMELYNS
jgi:hypothetical protein